MFRRTIALALGLALLLSPASATLAETPPQPNPAASVRIVNEADTAAESTANAQATGYVVKRGELLSGIAARFGISLSAIMRANGIRNANKIYSGQRLVIPSTGGPIGAPAPAAPSAPVTGGRRIQVSINQQRMFLYEGEKLVRTLVTSSGEKGRATATGNFKIQTKLPEAFASTWQLRMPYWMGIYYAGPLENGIHALPINRYGQTMWGGLLGRPASYGCLILSNSDAALVYNWAPMGTPVIIRY